METERKRSGKGSLTTGIVLTITFGVLWFINGHWAWIFPLVFAGVLPTINGIRRLVSKQKSEDYVPRGLNDSAEKEILKIAFNEKGRVTPALLALKTNLTLSKAEEILNNMTKKGHVQMSILEEGRIEYTFPDFLPEKKD